MSGLTPTLRYTLGRNPGLGKVLTPIVIRSSDIVPIDLDDVSAQIKGLLGNAADLGRRAAAGDPGSGSDFRDFASSGKAPDLGGEVATTIREGASLGGDVDIAVDDAFDVDVDGGRVGRLFFLVLERWFGLDVKNWKEMRIRPEVLMQWLGLNGEIWVDISCVSSLENVENGKN
jgi:hypothetical protein